MNTDDSEKDAAQTEPGSTPLKQPDPTPKENSRPREGSAGGVRRWWKDRGFTRSLEVIIAVATLTSAAVAWVQWQAMERNNAITNESVKEARRAADAAFAAITESKRQFDLARKDAADAGREERDRFLTSLVAQMQNAAVEQGLTRESLNESRAALEFTQRARIGVEEFPRKKLSGPGEPTNFSVRVKNSGAVPATGVRFRFTCYLGKTVLDGAALEAPAPGPFVSRGVLAGGAYAELFGEIRALTADEIKDLDARSSVLYCIGEILYGDGFGKARVTTFCGIHPPEKEAGWRICDAHNRAN